MQIINQKFLRLFLLFLLCSGLIACQVPGTMMPAMSGAEPLIQPAATATQAAPIAGDPTALSGEATQQTIVELPQVAIEKFVDDPYGFLLELPSGFVLEFMAESPGEIAQVLERLGEEDASNIDGPLAAALMIRAGLLESDFRTHNLWLLDPVENWKKMEKYLPHEEFEWIRLDGKMNGAEFDFPLNPGDLIYLIPSIPKTRGQFIFVHRTDAQGSVFGISNYLDSRSEEYRVGEILIVDGNSFALSSGSSLLAVSDFKSMIVWRKHDYRAMSPQVEKLTRILNRGGTWMVLVKQVGGAATFQRYEDTVIHPASVIKIAVGMLAVRSLRNEPGDLATRLTRSPPQAGRNYEQLLRAMLVLSEETATAILEKDARTRLGDVHIERILSEWGAHETKLEPRRSTARDTVVLLEGLYTHILLTADESELILSYLGEITENDRIRLWKLAEVLPEGAAIYNKRGSLTSPTIVADAGIVRLPDGSAYILCLYGFSDEWTSFEELDQIIGDFALAWYQVK